LNFFLSIIKKYNSNILIRRNKNTIFQLCYWYIIYPKRHINFNVTVRSTTWWTLVFGHENTLLYDIHLTNIAPKRYNYRRTCHFQLYKRLISSWITFTYFCSYLIPNFFHDILSILIKQRNEQPLVGTWWPRGTLYPFLMKTDKMMGCTYCNNNFNLKF